MFEWVLLHPSRLLQEEESARDPTDVAKDVVLIFLAGVAIVLGIVVITVGVTNDLLLVAALWSF